MTENFIAENMVASYAADAVSPQLEAHSTDRLRVNAISLRRLRVPSAACAFLKRAFSSRRRCFFLPASAQAIFSAV
jgi:hypothetical protein